VHTHRGECAGRREHEQDRVEDQPELRDRVVELALERGERDQERAGEPDDLDAPQAPRALGGDLLEWHRAAPLDQQHEAADHREGGAAEEQQVRRAPERHVLAEDPVPHVVERERRERNRRADEDENAAERSLEAAREPDGGIARPAIRHRARKRAGQEDRAEAHEDEVVRGVGERARVAAVVDVDRDVPVHAEDRDHQAGGVRGHRNGHPARQA
jgi:hypothetical protein